MLLEQDGTSIQEMELAKQSLKLTYGGSHSYAALDIITFRASTDAKVAGECSVSLTSTQFSVSLTLRNIWTHTGACMLSFIQLKIKESKVEIISNL